MLAAGTCQDGNLCGGAYSQCQRNTINNVNQGIAKAVSSKYFSTAYKVFAQGTHTVLLRHNNYMGCGGAFTDCLGSGPIVFKVETGEGTSSICRQLDTSSVYKLLALSQPYNACHLYAWAPAGA